MPVEGEITRVKGQKRGETWVWHRVTYETPEGTVKSYWVTVLLSTTISESEQNITTPSSAFYDWQQKNNK